MTTLTRSLLIVALAVALVAFGAFDPHDPEAQACPSNNPLCGDDAPVLETELACTPAVDCKDCREPEMQLATADEEKLDPIPDPISTPGATPATQLADCDGGSDCKGCREPEMQLAGDKDGNPDAPVVEMLLAADDDDTGYEEPGGDSDRVTGSYDAPVLEMELA